MFAPWPLYLTLPQVRNSKGGKDVIWTRPAMWYRQRMRPAAPWVLVAIVIGGVTGASGAPRPHPRAADETQDESPGDQPQDEPEGQAAEEERVPGPTAAPRALPSSGPASPAGRVEPRGPIE